MKQGLNPRRSRGRGNGRGRNPNLRNQQLDSNGPEGRIRGTASQISDRYLVLARDALATGHSVAAENFFQHAEHYIRLQSLNGANGQQPGSRPRPSGSGDEADRDDENGRGDEKEPPEAAASGGGEESHPVDEEKPASEAEPEAEPADVDAKEASPQLS